MKTLKQLATFAILFLMIACSDNKDDENSNNNPDAGILGDVGNSWDVKIDNQYDLSVEIIKKEGEVFTMQVSYAKFINKELKFGYNGNEIVDYVYSQGDISKPFTMVKFDAEVGETYTASIGGNFHHRQVVEIETYPVDCLDKNLKMIGVYEEVPEGIPNNYFGLEIDSIVWYWHEVYGLVCVEFYTTDGNFYEVEFVKIDL
jgi:hypothetical protein